MNEETNLLIKLMVAMADGQLKSPRDLAHELHTSEAMVQEMLAKLTEGGYLRRNAASCNGACNRCPLQQVCTTTPAIWILSDKGHRAIAQAGHSHSHLST